MDFLKGTSGTSISLLELSREDMLGMRNGGMLGSIRVVVWSNSVEVGSIQLSC